MAAVLRKAAPQDVETLAQLRAQAFNTDLEEARSWLQNIAGLDNVLVLERAGAEGEPGIPAALLGAVPVECGHRRGVWFCGMLTRPELRGRGLMNRLMDTCLRAYAAGGYDFAVAVPETPRVSQSLKKLEFKSAFPLRLVRKPIERNLRAVAEFDNLTVRRLIDARMRYQPACISLPDATVTEMVTRLYRKGMTIVSNQRGYGLFCQQGDVLQVMELQADNDHCADVLLQAAREKTGAEYASILLAENQTLYLGAGKRCGYGMIRFLNEPFPITDVYFRLLQ